MPLTTLVIISIIVEFEKFAQLVLFALFVLLVFFVQFFLFVQVLQVSTHIDEQSLCLSYLIKPFHCFGFLLRKCLSRTYIYFIQHIHTHYYSTGFPAHSCPPGINLPGGTTEFGPITAPLSILAPSKMMLLKPIKTPSSTVQLYRVQLFSIFTLFPNENLNFHS